MSKKLKYKTNEDNVGNLPWNKEVLPQILPNGIEFKVWDHKSCVQYFGNSNCITDLSNNGHLMTIYMYISNVTNTRNLPPFSAGSILHQGKPGYIPVISLARLYRRKQVYQYYLSLTIPTNQELFKIIKR